jgi:hypothetical protein
MASPNWLDAAASFATCQTLTATGSALVGTGVATMAAGGGGLVPLSLGMLSLLGAGAVCQNTPVDGTTDPVGIDGCYKASDGGFGIIQIKGGSFQDWVDFSGIPPWVDATELTAVNFVNVDSGTRWISRLTFSRVGGGTATADSEKFDTLGDAARVAWRLRVTSGTCAVQSGDPTPYPPGFHDTHQYTDPTTSCVYNINTQGFVQESEGGGAGMVFKIQSSPASTRASGGIVGGCNFEPTLVYQPPGGGPPTTIPWDPTWPDWDGSGTPPWLSALIGAAGGVAAVAIDKALDALFEAKYPAGTREIYAACNYKQDGSPETFSVTFPEENYQDRVLTSLNAIVDFQQQILLWRTPTCSGGGQSVTGEPVTINWISDEFSGTSGDRVQKLLTYFDQSGKTQAEHQAHWKDFSWQAGPVIVSCVGTPLGKPQVWAVSLDEAKRVINHAAAISGVDLTNAEWMTGSPRSSSFGLRGTMRVKVSDKGLLWVTKRDGPFGLPSVPA